MYTIDKNISVLPIRHRQTKYPVKDMQPGDSFFVLYTGERTLTNIVCTLCSVCKHHRSKYPDKTFTMRRVTEIDENGDEVSGVRCWRLS